MLFSKEQFQTALAKINVTSLHHEFKAEYRILFFILSVKKKIILKLN